MATMDLVTFGEAMLRLTPSGSQRLEDVTGFDAYVGGTELNVCVGATRLGLTTRWVSRLPDNPLGRAVSKRARALGVDVSCVAWTPNDRLGLYFVELADNAGARASDVVYDRAGSAMARVEPGMIDWDAALEGAKWFHVGGITPALSDSAAATLLEGMTAANERSITVSYDVNFRPKLWSAERARRVQEPLMAFVDVLIASEHAARLAFDATGDGPVAVARELQAMFDVPTVAITGRAQSDTRSIAWRAAVVSERGRTVHAVPEMRVDVLNPIGGGDAFAAGLIYGKLTHDSWDDAVQHGAAMVKLKYATPGDFSEATIADVERVLASERKTVSR
jgi:2-dehydro-3-deoxygluconokinase